MNRTKNFLLRTGIIIVLVLEFLAGYWLTSVSSSMRLLVFGVHLLLVVIFTLLFKNIKSEKFQENSNFTYVAFAIASVLPVYGMLGMFSVYLYVRNAKTQAREYFETDEHFDSDRRKVWIKDVAPDAIDIKRNEIEVDAFRDVLRTNDPQLEENAINKLSRSLTKKSVNILKDVVKTSTSDTKILAASALTEMEDKIIAKIETLRAQVCQNPDEENVLELARVYDLYCYLGVLDTVSEKHYQNLALEQYETFLQKQAEHRTASLEYGRILLNAGRTEDAIKNLRLALALSPEDVNPQIWLAEAYYRSQDYDNVRKLCTKLADRKKLPENIQEVVDCWTTQDDVVV
ncbi:tetratricopeptide repeat protein [candidate division KSB1 bacterium]|nr:tetratricopeptide repeat protein [candidate division KSB1 bacterium]